MTNDEITAEIERLRREGERVLQVTKAKYEGAIEYLQSKLREEPDGVDEATDTE